MNTADIIMNNIEKIPSIYDEEGRIKDPKVAHTIASIEDKGHLPSPKSSLQRIVNTLKAQTTTAKENLKRARENASALENREQVLFQLEYKKSLAVKDITTTIKEAITSNTVYNLNEDNIAEEIGLLTLITEEGKNNTTTLKVVVTSADNNEPQVLCEVEVASRYDEYHFNEMTKKFDPQEFIFVTNKPLISEVYNPKNKESILKKVFEKVSTIRATPSYEEKMELKHIDELNNLEDINNVSKWFKAEAEYTLGEDPISRIAILANYLERKQGKEDTLEIAKKFITIGNERELNHDWESDDIISEEVAQQDETSDDYTHIDLQWLEEKIFEYCHLNGDQDNDQDPYPPYVYKWNDEGLRKALKIWLEYIKTLKDKK